MAKPYLSPDYIQAQESGMLPDDETWEGENYNPKAAMFLLIPTIYDMFGKQTSQPAQIMEGLLYLKALVWVQDEQFHDELASLYVGDPEDEGKIILDKIAFHFGWTPTIEDIDFEEIPAQTDSAELENGPGNLPS
jgi:hypothetical protein